MQEIILPVPELKKALPGLNKIVSKKAILPVLESVQVARGAEGQLSLLATDLDSFATYHLKAAQPGPALAVLVPLAQLNPSSNRPRLAEFLGASSGRFGFGASWTDAERFK